jgi:xylan 1,4-beta-xylosidase
VYRLDSTHGSLLAAYNEMKDPPSPTPQQIARLRRAAQMPMPENKMLKDGQLTLVLPPHGLALIEFR